MARKPTGQPAGRRTRTADGTVATRLLKAKCTPDEYARVQALAKAAGCSLSEYVRSRCLSD
jgi:hypothetical protein